ncbi:MAG: heat shock protein Hsp20, partial [uncultured Rubrobacteraceae bacterium]
GTESFPGSRVLRRAERDEPDVRRDVRGARAGRRAPAGGAADAVGAGAGRLARGRGRRGAGRVARREAGGRGRHAAPRGADHQRPAQGRGEPRGLGVLRAGAQVRLVPPEHDVARERGRERHQRPLPGRCLGGEDHGRRRGPGAQAHPDRGRQRRRLGERQLREL